MKSHKQVVQEAILDVAGASALVVDDNRFFLGLITRLLAQQGHMTDVAGVSAAAEALEHIRRHRPDVLIIDLSLPDAGASEVIARLRAGAPEVKIVATGLLDFDGYRASALAAGADEFVAKPMLYSQLLPVLQRVLRDGAG